MDRPGQRKTTTKQASATGGRAKRTAGVQFIVTTQPGDATTSKNLSLIRSHVAKDIHARARQRRLNTLLVAPPRQPQAQGLLRRVWEDDEWEAEEQAAAAAGAVVPFQRAQRLGRRIAARPKDADADAERCRFSPKTILDVGRRDPYSQHVIRPLTEVEVFLLDYYVDWVIPFGYVACDHGDGHELFIREMKRLYVPFALTNLGLLTSVFMIAAHMYIKNHAIDPVRQDKYPAMAWKYTYECYHMANKYVENDNIAASDETISLALVMGCVEFMNGNYAAFNAHGKGITKMIDMRGGMGTLGLDGFLQRLIYWSIFNPRWRIVEGPYARELSVEEWRCPPWQEPATTAE